MLHTNFDVNALLEREALKPIWDKLTKKADKTAAATQAESTDEGALDDAALVKAIRFMLYCSDLLDVIRMPDGVARKERKWYEPANHVNVSSVGH